MYITDKSPQTGAQLHHRTDGLACYEDEPRDQALAYQFRSQMVGALKGVCVHAYHGLCYGFLWAFQSSSGNAGCDVLVAAAATPQGGYP